MLLPLELKNKRMIITGLDLVEYIAKKLEDEDVRVHDSNIVRYLRSMSHDELTKLLNNWRVNEL